MQPIGSSKSPRKRRSSIRIQKTLQFIQTVTLPHFKRYRYIYLLTFCISLFIMVIIYAQKIFLIRQNIAQLIVLHRSLYKNSTNSKDSDVADKLKMLKKKQKKQTIGKDQIQQAIKWKSIINQNIDHFSQLANQQLQYYQDKYNIIDYQEHYFCLVFYNTQDTDYNNHLNNLKSIMMQNYLNYQIIYIENTLNKDKNYNQNIKLIKEILMKDNELKRKRFKSIQIRSAYKQKFNKMIVSQVQKNDVSNLFQIAQQNCKYTQLTMFINKDNLFIGKQVLKLFNSVYQQTKYKIAYSNYIDSLNEIGNLTFIKNRYTNYSNFVAQKSKQIPLFAFQTKFLYYLLDQDSQNYTRIINNHLQDENIFLPVYLQVFGDTTYIPEISYQINQKYSQVQQKQVQVQKKNPSQVVIKQIKNGGKQQSLKFSHEAIMQSKMNHDSNRNR